MWGLIHTCDIARNETLGTNGRKSLQNVATSVPCFALPMNAKTAISNKYELGRAYDFYFAPTQDVKVGDVFTYAGDTYSADAVEAYNVPLVGHKHVMAVQEAST